jgi:putative copper export protein
VRDDLWTLVRFLHLLGAASWVGGMIVLGAVAVPAARAAGDRTAGRRVVTSAARRFGVVGAIAWVVLLGTGFALLDHRGLTLGDLPDSDYGRRVLAKIVLLLAMGVVTLLHALWQGPRVRRAEAAGDAAAARRWRLLGAAFDGFLLLAALATLWLAVSLVA